MQQHHLARRTCASATNMLNAPASTRMRVALSIICLAIAASLEADGLTVVANQQRSLLEREPKLSQERCVIQTSFGDLEVGFWPEVAPKTARHTHRLLALGVYTTNHFFRVDKGFVVQTADAASGGQKALNAQQKEHASELVPLEVTEGVKHHEGVLSMARGNEPGSGGGSFFIMLGTAPHLDMQYGAFGKVTRGMEVLHKMEQVPTERSGIFVMPKDRITFISTYCYTTAHEPELHAEGTEVVGEDEGTELAELKLRFENQAAELERMRKKCLPV